MVSYRSLEEEDNVSSLTAEEFDFIMICHGLQYTSHVPSFPGANRFKGTQTHSIGYREWTPFVDKTVLVVGIDNSACDVAMELSFHANQASMIIAFLLSQCIGIFVLLYRSISAQEMVHELWNDSIHLDIQLTWHLDTSQGECPFSLRRHCNPCHFGSTRFSNWSTTWYSTM